MREIRLHGSEGGGTETNRSFLPLSMQRPRTSEERPSVTIFTRALRLTLASSSTCH